MAMLCDVAAFKSFLATKPRLVLGSNSASRKTILNEIASEHGFTYQVVAAGIDEKSIRHPDPEQLVVTLGYEKAKAVMRKNAHKWTDGETYVITGDQVVVHDGCILEKPESEEEIRSNIRGFAETPAKTVGSVVCTHLPTTEQLHHVDIATIYMNLLPDNVIQQLIAEGSVFHSAGGLLAEDPLVSPYVTRIDGGLDAIMGMSKNTVMTLLVQLWNRVSTKA